MTRIKTFDSFLDSAMVVLLNRQIRTDLVTDMKREHLHKLNDYYARAKSLNQKVGAMPPIRKQPIPK